MHTSRTASLTSTNARADDNIVWLSPLRPRLGGEFVSVNRQGTIFLSTLVREQLNITPDTESDLRARIGVQGRTLIIKLVDTTSVKEFGTFPVTAEMGVSFNANRYVGMDAGRYRFIVDPEEREVRVDMDSRYEFVASA